MVRFWYRQRPFSVDTAALMFRAPDILRLLLRPQVVAIRNFTMSQAYAEVEFPIPH